MTPRLHSWFTLSQILALVASPRLRLQHGPCLELGYSKCELSKLELLKLDFLKLEIPKHGLPKVGISRHQKHHGLSHVKHW